MDQVRTISISLIRHAPTVYPKGTLPPYNPDITLDGFEQTLSKLATHLPADASWLESPLSRCKKTADAIIAHGAVPKTRAVIPALEEQRHGDWHGRKVADVWDELKDGPKSNWHFLHHDIAAPHGESFVELIKRLGPVMEQITSSEDNAIVVVAHAMVIKALVGMALGMSPAQSLSISIDPLSLTEMTYMASGAISDYDAGGAWQLRRLNQKYS